MSQNQRIIQRSPELRIEFLRWGSNHLIASLSSNQTISYSYSTQLGTMSAPFSLSLHLNTPGSKVLLFQELEPADIVRFSKKQNGIWRAQYIGLIQSVDTNIAVSGSASATQIQSRFMLSGIAITGIP